MKLRKYKLGEILELQRGYDLPSSQMKMGDVIVAGSNGIIGYHNTARSNYPCITVGRSGSVGKVHYYEQATWAHNTALFVKDFKGNNPQYLYYFLKNLHLDKMFAKESSVVPSLDRNIVHSLIVPFHKDITCQKRIASVLSNINRKIELNRAINQNLEALAKQLYDYWFVQFDFPNEEGKPYKSSGGKMVWNDKLKREIPEKWNSNNICLIADILSGGTPSKQINEYWDCGHIPFFGPTDYDGSMFQLHTADTITEIGLKHCSSSLFEENTVIITARGSIGKLVIVGTPMAMNQSCYALRAKTGKYEYLYFLTAQLIDNLKAKGSGSVFKSIITSDIESTMLCIANEEVISLYCDKISPIMKLIKKNTQEITLLIKQRDKLLPLLMNGQIAIE
ncbi:restriction endonuclease subunit S [Bacteroides sp. CG01]|uniref:restriction endonuclease subunit S n=1 Tax=Bacteroides sp. CG01 TaxID=3096000 RepID=UPI002B0033EB|nr:restriction endonuclease subunit S [Bacteroides sp. CG01]